MATPSARAFTRRQNGGARPVDDVSSPRIAHTLTACSRCRSRKTRCDPGLPRCGPCERTNSPCEYFDQARNKKMSRNYVVYLQHRVRDLEKQLAHLEKDDLYPDPEDLVRNGARVAIHDNDESKFLGPSSGIAITRLVMQLAKQFTGSASITEVIPENTAQDVKDQFERDDKKEYPLISAIAAERLPQRDLTNSLVRLFNLKVMAMYPFLHEPTFAQDVEDVYNGSTNAFQNFAVRMVIAVSLQRMDTQYAGLADSFYLAALQYFEEAVKPMNIKTIQCFALIAAYSLLTPTRTAVYYVIGLGVRLLQALGLCEEKTLSQSEDGRELNALEIDMNRRVFWSMINMDFALAHSLGRPSCFATLQEHIDVNWYHTVDDEYITPEGVRPGAPQSLKKWIGIHFHKMRLHQLEIRRKLYQKKRSEPVNDQDQWFKDMDAKIEAWKDATPEDVETGLDKAWFVGRYNTMVVFMYRPSPQVPRPSARAAARCYDAVKFNIYMHRAQIKARNVEMTWIFTQAIFMTINTILWSLSYAEIRAAHPREEVEGHLEVALECISQATERWPGVASAIQLYRTLVDAVIKIYDNEGDFPIEAGSPAESTGIDYPRSRTASPAAPSLPPHPSSDSAPNSAQGMRSDSPADESPFSYISPQPSFSFPARHSPLSSAKPNASNTASSPASSLSATPSAYNQRLSHSSTTSNNTVTTPYTPTPSFVSTADAPAARTPSWNDQNNYQPAASTGFKSDFSWNPTFNLNNSAESSSQPQQQQQRQQQNYQHQLHDQQQQQQQHPHQSAFTPIPALSPFDAPLDFSNMDTLSSNMPPSLPALSTTPGIPQVDYAQYLYAPSWNLAVQGPETSLWGGGFGGLAAPGGSMNLGVSSFAANGFGVGLNRGQQVELMDTLEASGAGQVRDMISATETVFYPQGYPNQGYQS